MFNAFVNAWYGMMDRIFGIFVNSNFVPIIAEKHLKQRPVNFVGIAEN